ncbi:unnamed protein product [Phytophthora fragariaefolia]|uniref:Unnamed protein product n=1 Tax=Phytophthora fragariaefolia TaxID=1490495 RepID=A0A9W6TPZ5_9STRA|nr:unnamed protein product [Phytophthora fragariaefolia]
MRVLTAALVGNPLLEHIKVTVPESWPGTHEAVPRACQHDGRGDSDHSSRGVQPSTVARHPQLWLWKAGAHEACLPSERTAEAALREVLRLEGLHAAAANQEPVKRRTPVGARPPTGEDLSLHDRRVGGTRHGGLAPESLATLDSRKSSDRLLVVHGRVRGYLLLSAKNIVSYYEWWAHCNVARPIVSISACCTNVVVDRMSCYTRNADKFADARRENLGAGLVSVRLANGSLVAVPRVLMDLSVKFKDFDNTERFIALKMDKYDLILCMPWLEKHGPWIDWRGKAIGASRPTLSGRALVSHVPTTGKSKGVREDLQGASAPEKCMEVVEVFTVSQEVTVDSDGERGSASRFSTGTRRAERASTDKVLQAAQQVSNLAPPEQGISRRESSVGNVVPRGVRKALIAWEAGDTVGNLVPREPVKAKQKRKVGEDASCVGNIVPHRANMANDARDEASLDVGNIVPRRGQRRRCRHRKSGRQSQTGVAQGDTEPKAKAPQTRSSDGHYHLFDSETSLRVKADAVQLEALPEVAELLGLEEMSLDDFLADLKAGEIAEMVPLRPEPTPEELNSSSVRDEAILEEFRKQRACAWVLRSSRTLRIWSQKGLRTWLGLANYLYKYGAGYAGLAKPLSDLLKKDTDWRWELQHQEASDSINASLQRAPILDLSDESKPFSVVCDTSYYAIGCALLQSDEDGHERVISFQSRQLKAAERNYPVHDKELLAMKYALVKFRVHLLGFGSQRIFTIGYALRIEMMVSLARYFVAGEDAKVKWISPRQRARLHRFEWADGLLYYRVEPGDPPRFVVPNDEDLKFDILQEAHESPSGGHLGREKTFLSVSQTFW